MTRHADGHVFIATADIGLTNVERKRKDSPGVKEMSRRNRWDWVKKGFYYHGGIWFMVMEAGGAGVAYLNIHIINYRETAAGQCPLTKGPYSNWENNSSDITKNHPKNYEKNKSLQTRDYKPSKGGPL